MFVSNKLLSFQHYVAWYLTLSTIGAYQ